jgi:DNA-binding winged helix-turn-helix (wHTH) protein
VIARFGPYELDSDRRQITHSGTELHVTPKAFDLLVLLIAECPRVVTKQELHQRLWPEAFVSEATLVSLVKEIRRAFKKRDAQAPIVRTAHGVGYAFAATLERVATATGGVSRWVVAGARRVALQEGENLIGRDPSSVIHLDVAGVSRRHARIVVNAAGVFIEDLGSKNGTTVGDQPLIAQTRLHDGDQVRVGPAVVIYHASAAGISTETVARPTPVRHTKT